MLRPILTRLYFLAFLVSFLLLVVPSRVPAQAQEPFEAGSTSTAEGMTLYQQGNFSEAAKVLQRAVKKNSNDANAWLYLGLSYYQAGYIGFSRRAFERLLQLEPDVAEANAKLSYALILGNEPDRALTAAKRSLQLGNQSAEPHFAIAEASLRAGDYNTAIQEADTTLKIDPRFFPAYVTRSFAHHNAHQDAEAASDLEQLLALNPEDAEAGVWRAQIEGLRALPAMGGGPAQVNPPVKVEPDVPDPNRVFTGKEVTVKVRVTGKPEPQYTEPARRAGVTGTVALQCVFGADGEVVNIFVRRSLGFGLTSQAVAAAKKIKFIPAQKDGSAVSMYMHLEYNFNLY